MPQLKWGLIRETDVRPSVCPARSSKRCLLEPWLPLMNTNRKLHAGSGTHRSAWPCGHQKWPKRHRGRKIYDVNISKIKRDWGTVTILNVNTKSEAAYHCRGSKSSENRHTVSPPSGRQCSFHTARPKRQQHQQTTAARCMTHCAVMTLVLWSTILII